MLLQSQNCLFESTWWFLPVDRITDRALKNGGLDVFRNNR